MAKKKNGRDKREALINKERLMCCQEVFQHLVKEHLPAPPLPLVGHLRGGVDSERMMAIKEQIEKREAARAHHEEL